MAKQFATLKERASKMKVSELKPNTVYLVKQKDGRGLYNDYDAWAKYPVGYYITGDTVEAQITPFNIRGEMSYTGYRFFGTRGYTQDVEATKKGSVKLTFIPNLIPMKQGQVWNKSQHAYNRYIRQYESTGRDINEAPTLADEHLVRSVDILHEVGTLEEAIAEFNESHVEKVAKNDKETQERQARKAGYENISDETFSIFQEAGMEFMDRDKDDIIQTGRTDRSRMSASYKLEVTYELLVKIEELVQAAK